MKDNSRYLGQIEEYETPNHTIKVEWLEEYDNTPPWEFCDSLGEVSDWQYNHTKGSGEMILCKDRGSARYYDFAQAVANLRSQGLSGEDAHNGAMAEYNRFKAWCNDEWYYLTAKVTISGIDDYEEYLGMIDSDYAAMAESELVAEAIHHIEKYQRELVTSVRVLMMCA